jgi:hypothetical protein
MVVAQGFPLIVIPRPRSGTRNPEPKVEVRPGFEIPPWHVALQCRPRQDPFLRRTSALTACWLRIGANHDVRTVLLGPGFRRDDWRCWV